MINQTHARSRILNHVVAIVLALACTSVPLAGCRLPVTPPRSEPTDAAPIATKISSDATAATATPPSLADATPINTTVSPDAAAATATPRSLADVAPVETQVSSDAGGELSVEGLSVVFLPGAFSSDTLVTAERMTDPPPFVSEAMTAAGMGAGDILAVGEVYDISLSGAALLQPALIVIPYDKLPIPAGHTAADLVIAQYRDGEWGILPTVVDTATQELRAAADHFTPTAVVCGSLLTILVAGVTYAYVKLSALQSPEYLEPDLVNPAGLSYNKANLLLKYSRPLIAKDRGMTALPKYASAMDEERNPTGMCIDFANLFGSLLISQGYPVRVVQGQASHDAMVFDNHVAGMFTPPHMGKITGGHLWVETIIDGVPYYVDDFNVARDGGCTLVPLAEAYERFELAKGGFSFWKEVDRKKGGYVERILPVHDLDWWKKYVEPQSLMAVSSGSSANNGGTSPTLTLAESWKIVLLQTYHWNDGKGATPGTIGLQDADGTVYGPWQATGVDAQGGVANGFWQAKPNAGIPAGTYTVIDSDPATWSQNGDTGGQGMTWVNGIRY